MVFEVTGNFASGGVRPWIQFPFSHMTSRKLLVLSGPCVCRCLRSMEQRLQHSHVPKLSLCPDLSAGNLVQAQGKLPSSLEEFQYIISVHQEAPLCLGDVCSNGSKKRCVWGEDIKVFPQ